MLRTLVVLAALALCTPALAQEGACAPVDQVLQIISKAIPITQVVKLDEEQTVGALTWWNEQEPKSNDAYTLAVLISHPNGALGLLMGKDGEICASLKITPAMTPGLFDAIVNPQKPGQPA